MSDGFIDELRNTLDKGAVLSGDDIDARYHHDIAGNPVPKPRAVVRPRTTEDVSALLRLCHREGVPVTTQGGMTGLVRAALPNADEIVLSMERMNSDRGGRCLGRRRHRAGRHAAAESSRSGSSRTA